MPRDAAPKSYPKKSKTHFFQRKLRYSLGHRNSQIPSHQYFQNGQHPRAYGPHQRTELQPTVLNSCLSPKPHGFCFRPEEGLMHWQAPLLFQLYQEELERKDTARVGHPEDEAHASLPVPWESLTPWCPSAASWKAHRITAFWSAQPARTKGYSQLNQQLMQPG